MNWLKILAGCACLVMTAHGLAAQPVSEPAAEPKTTEVPAKEVVVDPQAQDTDIARRLLNILKASEWFERPGVSTREGIVFLDGTTESEDRRQWAGNVARKTQDVVAVVNRIDVEPRVEWDFRPAWRETRRIAIQAQQLLPLLVLASIVMVISWLLAKAVAVLARWALRDRIRSPLLLLVASRAIAIPVFVLGVYLVLQVSGLTRLAITVLGGTGVIGIVLGFAFRDIAENFLASLLLSIRNPFNAGDVIEVAGHHGIVQNLNTRSTILLTLDGNHVQIPNATVFKSVIQNYTSSKSSRTSFVVGVGYEDSINQAQEVIIQVLRQHAAVIDDPEPLALVDELAASTVNLRVYFWFDATRHSRIKLTSAVMRRTKLALTEAGISMPDESREVVFPKGVPLVRGAPSTVATIESSPNKGSESESSSPASNTLSHEPGVSVGEGDLETDEEAAQRQAGNASSADARENLLDAGVQSPQST